MYATFCVLVRNLFGLVELLYIKYSSQSTDVDQPDLFGHSRGPLRRLPLIPGSTCRP